MVYEDGHIYDGDWVRDKRTGSATMIWHPEYAISPTFHEPHWPVLYIRWIDQINLLTRLIHI